MKLQTNTLTVTIKERDPIPKIGTEDITNTAGDPGLGRQAMNTKKEGTRIENEMEEGTNMIEINKRREIEIVEDQDQEMTNNQREMSKIDEIKMRNKRSNLIFRQKDLKILNKAHLKVRYNRKAHCYQLEQEVFIFLHSN
jgi:hypothetical protein